MDSKKGSYLFAIAIILSIAINAFMVLAFARARFFDVLYYMNSSITAMLTNDITGLRGTDNKEPIKQERVIDDSQEDLYADEIEYLTEDVSFSTAPGDSSDSEVVADTKVTDHSSDIRLEVPPLHKGLLRGSILKEPKPLEETSGLVLLKHNREILQYDLYWIGIYVGRAQLKAERKLTDLTITSEVHSTQFISNFYRVEDYAKSVVLGGRPHKFRIKQIEGKYKSDKETFFDYQNGSITFVDYLKNKQMEHTLREGIYWDVISGFYYLRSMPVIDKENIVVDVFDSNKFIKVQIVILGRETIELRSGKEVETIKAKVVLKSEGLFQKIGDIFIWLSDDVERIPLRVETKVPVGRVTAELRDIKIE